MLKKLLLLALDDFEFQRIFFGLSGGAAFCARDLARGRLERLARWHFPGASRMLRRFKDADARFVITKL